jgi:hypothetical protein
VQQPPVQEEIERLGLAEHVRELDELGATIVPPQRLGVPPAFTTRMRDAALATLQKVTGARWTVEAGCLDELAGLGPARSFTLTHMMLHDPVFADYVLNPVAKTLMRHLLGDDHRLSSNTLWVKLTTPGEFPGRFTTKMHADGAIPEPLPIERPHVANMQWLLTDYTEADGALCWVPGSHRTGRQAVQPDADRDAVPFVAPAGSAVFFRGGCWHGAYRRETPGVRLALSAMRVRNYHPIQQDLKGRLSEALLAGCGDPDYLRLITRQGDLRWNYTPEERLPGVPKARRAAAALH